MTSKQRSNSQNSKPEKTTPEKAAPEKIAKTLGFPVLPYEKIIATALGQGGDFAELFFEDVASTRVEWENSRVESIVEGVDRGVGLRVIFDRRTFYSYTTDLSAKAVLRLAEVIQKTVAAEKRGSDAKVTKAKLGFQKRGWTASTQPNREIADYQVKKPTRNITLKQKTMVAKRIENAARKALPEAVHITAAVGDSVRRILVLNSDGVIAWDRKNYFQMIGQVVGRKDSRIETAYESRGGYVGFEYLKTVTPESIGEKAAARVQILLEAKPAPSGTLPVVMAAEAGGTMIHEAVGHGLEADLACNGLSVYAGRVGEKVASSLVTVVDEGSLVGRRGSYAFDDEGTPSRRNVLIENGVLKGYMVDRLSAMKFDLMTTGNGRRESFRHVPIVRMTNTYIAPGKHDPDSILRDTPKGIFVKAMGGGQVDTVTGDFVFAVTEGYLIRDGKIGEPIRGATLVGNGPKAMSIVDRVGTDLDFITGTCGKDGQHAPVTDAQPTLRIPELTVGGEVSPDEYW